MSGIEGVEEGRGTCPVATPCTPATRPTGYDGEEIQVVGRGEPLG